jgi:hypothetical protein
VVLAASSFGESRLAIIAQLYLESFVFEKVTERPSQIVVILDDQYTPTFITHCK